MRILGYILLICGFIVIMLGQAIFLKTALAVYSQSRKELAAKDTFSKDEVETALLNTAKSAAYHSSGSPIGPISMIAGGVLLDVARRRKKEAASASGS